MAANVQKRNMHCIGWEKKTPERKKKERTTTLLLVGMMMMEKKMEVFVREPGGGKTAGALPQSPDVVQPSRSTYSCLTCACSTGT